MSTLLSSSKPSRKLIDRNWTYPDRVEVERCEKEILALIESRGTVDFLDLEELPGMRGREMVLLRKKLFITSGLTREGGAALLNLIRSGKVRCVPVERTHYARRGFIMSMPVAKECRDYSKDHWWPVVFALSCPEDPPAPGRTEAN